ncbi:MAG: zinc ribbon domain-containing protein [Anaerolineales bacterium]|nr:zinc ribbon domain-containing protein [Anaerolineales bacterium]
MDEINCPLCGKPNPVENKYCEYCLGHLENEESSPKDPVFSDSDENQDGLGGHSSEAEKPEWLNRPEGSSSSEIEPPREDLGLALPAADTSDWMPGSSKEDPSIQDEDPAVSPFVGGGEGTDSGEIPSWLNDALGEESSPEGEEIEDTPEIPREQDQPDEQEKIQKTPGSLESAGPLAGLTGLLSAEPGVARIRKPGVYSTKVRVSESQQEHVELLQGLLEDEGQPKPLPRKSPISQQHILRWGIAIVLLLAIFWSILLPNEQSAFPVYDEGSAELNRLINQLPEEAKVLVGFDYEPGLVDELDSAAAPVFNHLMNQGAVFTLISTSPNGPILAERFFQVGRLEYEYISGLEYINLGYIPGGAAGLLSFIENPSGTTPYSIAGVAVWETETGEPIPPVIGIEQISDYEMIVLLVDDPDLARIWIEQLSPIITNPQTLTSLVLITSAQLEPVVRPYYESLPQPVNGLVVGLRGGASYSRLVGGDQLPGKYWDAFGMGTFVAALLILVGGLGYYVVPELSRTVRGEEKVD